MVSPAPFSLSLPLSRYSNHKWSYRKLTHLSEVSENSICHDIRPPSLDGLQRSRKSCLVLSHRSFVKESHTTAAGKLPSALFSDVEGIEMAVL